MKARHELAAALLLAVLAGLAAAYCDFRAWSVRHPAAPAWGYLGGR